MNREELILEIKKQLQEELKHYTSSMTDQINNKIPDEYKKQAKDTKDSTEVFIQENPWIAVGLAAFIGYILARLIYKRRD